MPRLKEELQFPDLGSAQRLGPDGRWSLSLINENGVLKILRPGGNTETVLTSDDLDQSFQYSNYYTKAEINNLLLSSGAGVETMIVDSLPLNPTSADEGVIFLVPKESGYREYLYVGGDWEEIGDIDLSGYLTKAEFDTAKQTGLATFRDWEA